MGKIIYFVTQNQNKKGDTVKKILILLIFLTCIIFANEEKYVCNAEQIKIFSPDIGEKDLIVLTTQNKTILFNKNKIVRNESDKSTTFDINFIYTEVGKRNALEELNVHNVGFYTTRIIIFPDDTYSISYEIYYDCYLNKIKGRYSKDAKASRKTISPNGLIDTIKSQL